MITKDKANQILDAMQADDGDAVQILLGGSIQSGEMTKDQANALLDAMQADDGDAVMQTLGSLIGEQKPLALRPPEDFSPQYTDTEQALKSIFPRLSTEGGDNILSDVGYGIGDVLSLPGRSALGLSQGLATASGALLGGQNPMDALLVGGQEFQNQMQTRGATDPNAPWYDPTALAESVLKDPTLPLIPATGGLSAMATRGISSPLLRGTAGGALEGLGSSVLSAGMEQRGLENELQNIALGTGLGGGLGLAGGAIGKAISPSARPTPEEITGFKLRFEELAQDPTAPAEQVGKAFDELSQAREQIAKGEKVDLPWYIPRDESGQITPDLEGDVPFAIYQQRANEVKAGLTSEDPFFVATDNVLAPAMQKLNQQRQAFGDKIKFLEKEMGGYSTSAEPTKALIASELDKAGRRAIVKDVLDEDGDVIDQVVQIEWKPNIQRKGKQSTKSLSPEMIQIVEEVSLLDDAVNFETLRSIIKDLNGVVKRSATPDPLAQAMLKSLNAQLKQQARGMIEVERPELLGEWDDAMKGYAERKNTIDLVERKVGKKLENAEGWLKSMVTTGARSSDEMARKIKEYTGADLRKAAAFARYANETAGIKERGASLLSETGKMADELQKQTKKLPVVGAVQDLAQSAKTALTPKPKSSRATIEVIRNQRATSGPDMDKFFADYFKSIASANRASSALNQREQK